MGLPIKLELPKGFLCEEIRDGYTVTSLYKELWAVELDLLNELMRVCEKHGLTYYAIAGTLLGAVRHGGFVPWDDDLDIAMPRDDYDRLCTFASEFSFPYFLQTEYTDPGSLRGHAQLRNSQTTGVLEYDLHAQLCINQGIFIDVFPLDNIPDDERERRKFSKQLARMKRIIHRIRDIPTHPHNSASRLENAIKDVAAPIITACESRLDMSHELYKKYEALMRKYSGSNTREVGILCLSELGGRFNWEANRFKDGGAICDFEFLQISIPAGYEDILSKSYGDWRMPVQSKSGHGGLFFLPEMPYPYFIASR
jgi:lipopolysaccharide cholinephosphotransferase